MADEDAPENYQNPPSDASGGASKKEADAAAKGKKEAPKKEAAPKEKKAAAESKAGLSEKKKESVPEEKEEGESAPPKEKKPAKSAQEKKDGADGEGAQKKKGKEPAPEKKGGPEPEAGAPQQKKGIFSKLSEKLKKKPPAEAQAQEKKVDGAKPDEKKEEKKKEGFFSKLFKKKEKAPEEGISLAPTIVSAQPNIGTPQTEAQIQQAEKIITPTVAPVPQETFFQKLRGLFKKEPPMPLEIPTHCAVCGIDLHTVYSYTCSNCRKIACYYCVRSFNEKTYCAKCLKEKGIL